MNIPFAITLPPDTGLANKTGTWRTDRPRYVSLTPPCDHACPAGENVREWLYLAEEGRYEEAWRVIVRHNPFPAIHGRVCYHPCESACNRGQVPEGGGPVSIHAVERFLGDEAIRRKWTIPCAPPTGKSVLVVGSGPCGLSCAYHLARLGHRVTVAEAGGLIGGMMRYGIPAYRLPRDVLDAEVARLTRMGVRFETGTTVRDVASPLTSGDYGAVFLAIGAGVARHVDIPAADAKRMVRVLDAVGFLRDAAGGQGNVRVGRRVAVYGGGNTAMDAARVARRLGAEEAVVIYRRDAAHAPAHAEEVREALDDGVVVRWLRTIKGVDAAGDLRVEEMGLDADGRPVPTGRVETLGADTLILAVGQTPDSDWLAGVPGVRVLADGSVTVDDALMTGYPGLFAGGDMVPAERTVTTAVGHGRRAARAIDAYLRGIAVADAPPAPLATVERLNPWYYTDAPASVQPALEKARRTSGFDETVGGLDADTALYEARRCMSCGNCFGCDNCFGVCPDNAVIKLGPGRYEIDLDYCKGCGLCAAECPCGAIAMEPEPG